jgi:hypothetical protein
MRAFRKRLSYANVASTFALFLVLGGGAAFAASQLAKNSVGSKQLKKNSVTAVKIKKNAVDGSKVKDGSLTAKDLNDSVLGPYAKRTELLNGNDVISPDPAAALSGAIYNVGPGGVDCQGAKSSFPNSKEDDIDFSTIDFDTGGLAHTEPGASPNCYNGFQVPREGTYAITAWIAWDAEEGDREVTLMANRSHGKGCCDVLAISEQTASTPPNTTSQTLSAITRLQQNDGIFIQGRQDSGNPLDFFGGGIQIAWLGP